MKIESYPLQWPIGYTRTKEIVISKFKKTPVQARDFLYDEIRRLKASDLIISTNIPVKQNGELYADWQRYKIDNHGVAIYFKYKDKHVCLCCDKYERIFDNIYAIARTIEALRQIYRDGVSDFLDNAFTGFKALPQESTAYTKDCWYVLYLGSKPADVGSVHAAYKALAKKLHPDAGGSDKDFIELSNAYQEALSHFKK